MEARTIYPSRKRTLILLFISLLFVVGSFSLLGPGRLILWVPFVFFSGCGLVLAVNLLPSASFLRMEVDHFTVVSFFSASRHNWENIRNFRTTKQRVVVEISPDGADQSVFAVRERELPLPFGFRPEETARMLNEFLKEKMKLPTAARAAISNDR